MSVRSPLGRRSKLRVCRAVASCDLIESAPSFALDRYVPLPTTLEATRDYLLWG